ncbi:MAG: hypothetical protein GX549_01745 [Clostridiales bacterium]|nr:hypothetical protein [Clostridiales bacterium]
MPLDYVGHVCSPVVSGEAALAVGEDALKLTSLFDIYEIPYSDISAFTVEDYAAVIKTGDAAITVSRLGNACEPFYRELYDAYNAKVRKALFVQGTPLIRAEGGYEYREDGREARGTARIELYEDCVLVLPPDDGARRVPLCFVSAMERGDFSLTLRLITCESYTFFRLGRETEPFWDALTARLRALRERAIRDALEIDNSLTPPQSSAIARLMTEGVAAPMGALSAIAPGYVAALEAKIRASRSAQSYDMLKTLCEPALIRVGVRKSFAAWGQSDEDAARGEDPSPEPAPGEPPPDDRRMIWMIAPGQNGHTAAVEFAVAPGESAATFIYRFQGEFEAFASALNRAMEAVGFRREAIRLTDDELRRPEYAEYLMAVRRNPALRFIRSSFAGRVIHSSPERWAQGCLEYMR